MSPSINRIAPSAVVVALVIYGLWPYLFASSDAEENKEMRTAEIADARIAPNILPPPSRDPFRQAGEPATGPAKTLATATGRKLLPAGANSASAAAARKAAPSGLSADADPKATLVLTATSICGKRRLAVINGRIYTEGEKVSSRDTSAPPRVIARILPYQVVLECRGQSDVLRYSDLQNARPSKKPSPSPSGRGPG